MSQFIEKPDEQKAQQLIDSHTVLWNSGTFLLNTSLFLEEAHKHTPDLLKICRESLAQAKHQHVFLTIQPMPFVNCESISIDYALLEKTNRLLVVALDLHFIDIGSWESLYEYGQKDHDHNVCKGPVHAENTRSSFLYSDNKLLVTTGLNDHIVVVTQDSVLAAKKGQSQELKNILPKLEKNHAEQLNNQPIVQRPWGSYEVLTATQNYKVKRLIVNPGAQLSLQLHQYRAEHWVVVAGQATIICDETLHILNEHDSFYIPVHTKHRISNNSTLPLVIVETQIGEQVDEHDIMRFEDTYERQ